MRMQVIMVCNPILTSAQVKVEEGLSRLVERRIRKMTDNRKVIPTISLKARNLVSGLKPFRWTLRFIKNLRTRITAKATEMTWIIEIHRWAKYGLSLPRQ